MELKDILERRRSVRQYDPSRPVARELIDEMIRAAQEAPSWKNTQTGRYHVVLSAEKLAALKQCLAPQNQLTVGDAPALVVCTFKHNISGFNREGEPDNEVGNGWGIYDLGLQNMLLQLRAAELGIDSVVLGLRDADAIRQLLEIPQEETIVSVIGLGYRAQEPQRPKRKELEAIAKYY